MKDLVFVYGTLMRGFVNHEPFLSQAVSLGDGTTEGILYSTSSGRFPGMVHGNGVVYGEVYEVSTETLRDLDQLEGYHRRSNDLYTREEVSVDLRIGVRIEAWAYFYNRPVKPEMLIPSGNWRAMGPHKFSRLEVNGHECLFTDDRELGQEPLEGYPFKYDIRHDDDGWEPCNVEKHGCVIVNYYGTILTKEDVFPGLEKHGDYIPIKKHRFLYYVEAS